MSAEKKFYTYQKVECTKLEYIKSRQDLIRFTQEEIDKANTAHLKRINKKRADIKKYQDQITEAQKS